MGKKVLSIGQCAPDHATLSRFLEANFGAAVVPACLGDDAIAKLTGDRFDLVLINRKLDADYSDGMCILQRIKSDPKLMDVPVMVVTNYPEHQQAAVAAGAVVGFGKLEYEKPETKEKLKPFLG